MAIQRQEHSEKGVTDRQTERETERQKEVFLELLGRGKKIVCDYVYIIILHAYINILHVYIIKYTRADLGLEISGGATPRGLKSVCVWGGVGGFQIRLL